MVSHRWTEDQVELLRVYAYGHSYVQITEEVNEVFGLNLKVSQIRAALKNRKIKTGRTGHFWEEGNNNAKKWEKGEYPAGCEKSWFKKGNIPDNHKPIGSERITTDGYVMVKVAEPNKYKLKHRVIYEAVFGEIPEGYQVTFIDGNSQNCCIENLMLMTSAAHMEMTRQGYWGTTNELKVAAVNVSEIAVKVKERSESNGI